MPARAEFCRRGVLPKENPKLGTLSCPASENTAELMLQKIPAARDQETYALLSLLRDRERSF